MINSSSSKTGSFRISHKVGMLLLLVIPILSSCSIFRGGCHCPKVSYAIPHQPNSLKKV